MEDTIVRVLDEVPPVPGWAWLPDCNVIGVSSQLCPEGRERAIADLQAQWRRSLLRIVTSSETMSHGHKAEETAVR